MALSGSQYPSGKARYDSRESLGEVASHTAEGKGPFELQCCFRTSPQISGLGHFYARQFLRANWPPPELAVSIRQPAANFPRTNWPPSELTELRTSSNNCDFNSSVEFTQPRFWTRLVSHIGALHVVLPARLGTWTTSVGHGINTLIPCIEFFLCRGQCLSQEF